ncbi:MAG: phosphoglycolate phosphatase [Janthinobacterium lividum]
MSQFSAHTLRLAIIDLDGTMVDTSDDFAAALNGMLAELSLAPIARDEVIRYVGKGSENLLRSVLSHRTSAVALSADALHEAMTIYERHYAQVNGRFSALYPEVADGLRQMRANGLRLACVTNKPRRFAVDLLRGCGLIEQFELIYGGDSWPRRKPDPQPMLEACKALGVSPAQAVAIGDSENDAMAARAAGIASLTVPYGYNHGRSVQSIDTDAIVPTLLSAAQLIAPAGASTLNPSYVPEQKTES